MDANSNGTSSGRPKRFLASQQGLWVVYSIRLPPLALFLALAPAPAFSTTVL